MIAGWISIPCTDDAVRIPPLDPWRDGCGDACGGDDDGPGPACRVDAGVSCTELVDHTYGEDDGPRRTGVAVDMEAAACLGGSGRLGGSCARPNQNCRRLLPMPVVENPVPVPGIPMDDRIALRNARSTGRVVSPGPEMPPGLANPPREEDNP